MNFFLYDASSSGTCLWSNDSANCDGNDPSLTDGRSVTLTTGLFTQNLGDTSDSFAAIADSVFGDNTSVYLEVDIAGETLSPRKRLTAAPYALNAQRLDGIDSTGFLASTGDTAAGIFDFTAATLAGASPLIFEGATADDFETTFTFTDPTGDNVYTFQDASGTVAFLSDVGSGLWEDGAQGVFENDEAVIIGSNAAFTYGSGGIGDLRVADELEVIGTIFAGGTIEAVGIIHSDISFTASTTTTFGAGAITTTGSTDLALSIAGGDLTFAQNTTIGDGGDSITIDTSDWDISATGDLSGIGTISTDGDATLGADLIISSGARIGTGSTPTSFTALANDSLFVEGAIEVDGAARFDSTMDINGIPSIGADITFDAATPTIVITNGETFAITDGTNTLFSLADAGTTGNLTLSGDLAVNGDNITSDSNLRIQATGYVAIGDDGAPGAASSDDDLYIYGGLEVDATTTLDGTFNVNGDSTFTLGASQNISITNTSAESEVIDLTVTAPENDAIEINFTLGNDGDADTLAALDIITTSAATGDIDILRGINIANLISADGTVREQALVIGSGWDTNLLFADVSTFIDLADTGVITWREAGGTSTLMTLTDNANVGDLLISGDFTIQGDNLDSAGAPLVLNATAADEVRVGTGTPGIAVGAGDLYVTSDIEADGNLDIAGSATFGSLICNDCFDFTEFADALALDASTSISMAGTDQLLLTNGGTGDIIFNLSSSGDFVIQDNGTPSFTASDNGTFTFDGAVTFNSTTTHTLATSENISISNNTATTEVVNLTVTSAGNDAQEINFTLGNDGDADSVSALEINVTSAATGDADVIQGLRITNLTSPDATVTEVALQIGSGWDTNLLFSDISTFIDLEDAGVITWREGGGGNALMTLTDNANVGDLLISGDFTIQGDNLDSAGAPLVLNATAADEVRVGTGTPLLATGAGDLYVTSDLEVAGAVTIDGSATVGSIVCSNCLDFTEFKDILSLDASTTIQLDGDENLTFSNNGTGDVFVNLQSTGDFYVADAGTDIFRVQDSGVIDIDGLTTFNTDVDLTFVATENLVITNTSAEADVFDLTVTAAENDGAEINFTLGNDGDADIVNALEIRATSAATGDSDVLRGINIAQLSSSNPSVSEIALRIANGWDSNLTFADTSTFIDILDTGVITFRELGGSNTLMTLTDNSNVGDLVLSGDLAVNGDDITTDGKMGLNATGYVRVGDSGTPGSANSDDDLYVEGGLEIDATSTFDGYVLVNSYSEFALAGGENIIISNAALTDELIDITTTSSQSDAIEVNFTLANDGDADTLAALDIQVTSAATADADLLYAINIANLTAADASVTETALAIGTGWDTGISIGANSIVGTTGLIDYTNFDVLASGAIEVTPNVGLDTNVAGVLSLATTNATSITTGNALTTFSLAGTGLTTLNVATGNTSAATLNLATSNQANVINIGTGTGVDDINIGGGGTGVDTINIGDSTATVAIQGGSITFTPGDEDGSGSGSEGGLVKMELSHTGSLAYAQDPQFLIEADGPSNNNFTGVFKIVHAPPSDRSGAFNFATQYIQFDGVGTTDNTTHQAIVIDGNLADDGSDDNFYAYAARINQGDTSDVAVTGYGAVGVMIINENNGTTDAGDNLAGFYYDNQDTDAVTVDAFKAASSGSTITDGLDVSDSDIVNGVNVGENFVLYNAYRAFDLTGTGLVWEDTDGNDLMILTYNANEGDLLVTGDITADDFICTDCLDFAELADALTVDASTSITMDSTDQLLFTNGGTGDIIFNLSSTGDFVIQDAGSARLSVTDNGTTTVAQNSTENALFINQDGNGKSIVIDSEATSAHVVEIQSANTSGNVIDFGWGTATTQAGSVTALDLDLNTEFTSNDGNDLKGVVVTLDALVADDIGTVTSFTGYSVSGGTLATDPANVQEVTWYGLDVTMPDISAEASDSITSYGIRIVAGTASGSGGTEDQIGIDMGTTKIDFDADNDTSLSALVDDVLVLEIGGVNEFRFDATSISPVTADTNSLGNVTNEWNLLFLGDNATALQFGSGQDATIGIDTGNDALEITVDGVDVDYVSIGATALMGHLSASDGDLLVTDELEVNGTAFFDASVTIGTASVPTSDMLSVSNSGFSVTTDVKTASFVHDATNVSTSAVLIDGAFGSSTGGLTYYILELGAISPTISTPVTDAVSGLYVGAMTDPGVQIKSSAVNIASGWDIDLSLQNAEYISNSTDDRILFGGSGGLNDVDLVFNLDNANGPVIGTSTSSLQIDAVLMTDLDTAGGTSAVCHSGAASATDNVKLEDCTGAPAADYAEQYPVAAGVGFGDIVVPSNTVVVTNDGDEIVQMVKSSEPYSGPVVGIVSDNFGDFTSAGYNIDESDNPMPVALVGRVPVKVTAEGGDISVGDYLTTSSTPGAAMRATKVGRVIGMALSDWDGVSATVMVQVNNSWSMGDVIGTDGVSTLVTDNVVISELNEATAQDTSFSSYGLALRGSAWNGTEAQAVEMMLQNVVEDEDNYRLSVRNTADSEVAYITNEGTMRIAGDMVIGGNLYPSDRGVPQTEKYIYYDGSEGPGGDFMRTNASGWSTGSYDFAEMFPSTQKLTAGELVAFSGSGHNIQRATGTKGEQLAGIISTRPGFLAGENVEGAYPVALAGRVPTRVSAEGGAIAVGDPLTISSSQGIAMKAKEAGVIVGYALEAYSGGSDNLILTYVNLSYWVGETTNIMPGTDNRASGFATSGTSNFTSLNMSGNIYMGTNSITGIGRLEGLTDAWSIEQDGTITTTGLIVSLAENYQGDQVETMAVTSPEVMITLTGTATLEDGQAEIRFEQIAPEFNDIISAEAPIRVLVTPSGPVSLYVSEKDQNHFVVTRFAGEGDVEFDWMVTAYRRGYEPEEIEEVIEEEMVDEVVIEPVVETVVEEDELSTEPVEVVVEEVVEEIEVIQPVETDLTTLFIELTEEVVVDPVDPATPESPDEILIDETSEVDGGVSVETPPNL